MREEPEADDPHKTPGPFLTISRQYGCHGYFLGLLLVDVLNSNLPGEENPWKVYQREILERISRDTDLSADLLNRLRRQRPRLLADFFRNLSPRRRPRGFEVRGRIAEIIRHLAEQGHAIIVGMGGAGATADIANGLRIRLEGPRDWRVNRVVEAEGVSLLEARLLIQQHDRQRTHLRRIYTARFHREPAFDLVYDASVFSLGQITQHIVHAMKLKKMI